MNNFRIFVTYFWRLNILKLKYSALSIKSQLTNDSAHFNTHYTCAECAGKLLHSFFWSFMAPQFNVTLNIFDIIAADINVMFLDQHLKHVVKEAGFKIIKVEQPCFFECIYTIGR